MKDLYLLTHRPHLLSPRVAGWGTLALLGVLTLWGGYAFLNASALELTKFYSLPVVWWLWGLVLVPPLVAFMAAWLTWREVSSENFELLLLTGLPPHALIWNYMHYAFYRTRWLWLLAVAALPALTLSALEASLHATLFECRRRFESGNSDYIYQFDPTTCAPPSLALGFAWLLVGLGLLGLIGLGVILGVTLALWWRHWVVWTVAPLVVLCLGVFPFGRLFLTDHLVYTLQAFDHFNVTLSLVTWKTWELFLAPYAAMGGLWWLATRVVRARLG